MKYTSEYVLSVTEQVSSPAHAVFLSPACLLQKHLDVHIPVHTHTHTKCLYTGWNFYFVALTLRLLSFLCVFSGASIKNVATLLLSAVAMRGPAALPFLCLALWAERLLGFCPGQHGRRDDHGNDEGSWRGFSWRSVPSRNTHMPLWLPVPSQGRPVFWSRLVSVWEGNRASVCISVKLCLHFTVCECGRKFRKGNKIVVLLIQTLHNIYEPFFRVGGRGFLHWDNGGIFWQGRHVFEGFGVPDFEGSYWVGEEETLCEQNRVKTISKDVRTNRE